MGADARSDRRRYAVAWLLGSVPALLIFGWMVNAGRWSFVQYQRFGGGFFDAQARALADGHWDLRDVSLGPEAFVVGGKSYIYFGPVPALLRLPILAVTDLFDGRLTQVSMLLAWAVAMLFAARLGWQVRALVRPASPWTRLEAFGTALFAFVLGAGSTLLFLASRAWVYHEVALWAVAFALGAYGSILAFLVRPTPRRLIAAVLLATLAFLTRPTVGGGPVLALGLLLAAQAVMTVRPSVAAWLRDRGWAARLPGNGRAWLAGLAVAVLVPAALYVAVNEAKFGSIVGLPFEGQSQNLIDRTREETLRANDGTLFNVAALPTNLVQLLRPDAIRLDRLFPFVDFPPRATVIGDVRFDLVDRATSLPAAMPFFVVLAAVGLVALVRSSPTSERRPSLALLRVPVLGAVGGGLAALLIVYVANRYAADFLPLLVLLALPGLHVLLRRVEVIGVNRVARVGAVVLVGLAAWGVYANFSLALLYQRLYSPVPDVAARADFIDFQQSVADALGVEPQLGTGAELPREADDGDLFVIGDCDGLYRFGALDVTTGRNGDRLAWAGIERTPATGRYRLEVTLPEGKPGELEPLLVSGTRGDANFLAVEYLEPDRIAFAYGTTGGEFTRGDAVDIEPGEPYEVDVIFDRRVSELVVTFDDQVVLSSLYLHTEDDVVIGRNPFGSPVEPRFTGAIEPLPADTAICRELLDRAG